jgi:hypothetical protein
MIELAESKAELGEDHIVEFGALRTGVGAVEGRTWVELGAPHRPAEVGEGHKSVEPEPGCTKGPPAKKLNWRRQALSISQVEPLFS